MDAVKWTKNGRVDGVRKNGQKMDAVKWTYWLGKNGHKMAETRRWDGGMKMDAKYLNYTWKWMQNGWHGDEMDWIWQYGGSIKKSDGDNELDD